MKILISYYRELPEEQIERIRATAPGHKVVVVPVQRPAPGAGSGPPAELIRELADTHILFGFFLPPNLLDLAPNLRWVQLPGAGIERFVSPQIARGNLLVTNASGSSAFAIGEYIIGGMLWFAKGLAGFQSARREHRYHRRPTQTLRGKTLAIIGHGAIGRETARLARPFGLRILAIRRNPPAEPPPDVDQVYPPEALLEVLAQADYTALCVPLTAETRGLIGARELAAMPPHAVLINVARGPVIDEPALIRALQERRIAGAVLDVFATEPLPADSPLWEMDNVLLTPHVSGDVEGYTSLVFDIFEDNLRRFLAGRPLRNVVDLARGY